MGSQSAAHWVEHLTMKLVFSCSTCFSSYPSFLTLYLEQAVKFDCLRCKSSIWGSPEIWFSHSSEKSFFLLFLCLTLQISRVWLYLVGTVSSYSMMYSGHYTFCFNLLYLKSKSYAQKVLLLLQYI